MQIHRWHGSLIKSILAAALVGQLAACGGGSSSPPAPPDISTAPLPNADVNKAYSADLTATGAAPFTWTVTGLPAGLTLDSNTGRLSGAPTQIGTFNLAVEAKGPGGTDTDVVSLTVLDKTQLVSVNSDEVQATGQSGNGLRDFGAGPELRSIYPSISDDGRFVSFDSLGTNMGAANGKNQIYLRDRQKGETFLISVSTAGVLGSEDSHVSTVSDDGRFVAFDSYAPNLVANDSPDFTRDIFLRDRTAGTTVRISQNPIGGGRDCPNNQTGELCNSFGPSMSADGELIAFGSLATLKPGEDFNTGSSADIYLYHRSTGQLDLVTRGVGGVAANGASGGPQVSPDGRFVVFESTANNLVPNDPQTSPGIPNIFVYNVATRAITKISVVVSSPSVPSNGVSQNATISNLTNNRVRIAFSSLATNLGGNDTTPFRDIYIVDWSGIDGQAPTNLRRIGGNADSDVPSISRDGQFVALHSLATDFPLTGVPSNGLRHIFTVEVDTSIKLASTNSGGAAATGGESRFPKISGNGQFVTYYSAATNLVSPDNVAGFDAFLSQRP